jgi:Cu/Ag efflux pump CusA/multidrug efflux pump subunit AcrA (membrane-fusion protein)
MPLTRVDDAHPAAAPPAQRTPLFYRNPMRADVTSPVPAKDEMGMDYIPVYADDTADVGAGAASDVAGHAAFTLSHERQQLIGVRRSRVERRALSRDIRAVGTVAYDPQLYQAINDYRQALAARAGFSDEALPEARSGSDAIARAAALRLRQLGLSESQVRDAGRGGGDPGALLLPGANAWVYAQVYEYEIESVRPGQQVTVSLPSHEDRTYRGTVVAIDPILDAATRTARVRVQVATPDGGLRPQSFVTALIHVPTVEVVAVPSDAILDTGREQFIFVVEEGTRFAPRAVRTGREAGGWTEIVAGVEPGVEVVTSANFLIDSESRFRAAVAAFQREAASEAAAMIERIIEFSAHNRILVLLLTGVALAGAWWAVRHVPLDAIPDLSDTQVIVFSRWDRSPDILEDQVTYPIVTALLGAPKVKAIRGFSDFGYSYVYVIFEDGTDLYWARSRVLEYLSKILPRLPEGVRTEMGPDATSVGWVYQYALVDRTGQYDLAQLRSLQDWYLRYHLQAVPGVAEVAAVGGFAKQYQVNVDPTRLLAYNIPLTQVIDAVRKSNNEVGGRLMEFAGTEYMVRGRGYLKGIDDLAQAVVGVDAKTGTPILVRSVADVVIGPDIRRGVADLDGLGDTVGGIVVMRQGENALTIIDRVKARLEELKPSLPPGVEIVTTYDRSGSHQRSIDTLLSALSEEMLIVSLVILLFLWHVPSALVPIVTIPVSVFLAFIPFYYLGLSANIMSLAGIAISIGVLVDGAIVEVENAYKRLEEWIAGGRRGDFHAVRLQALKEVGPSVFFSLLVIAVAFLPIFVLVDQEGRLFKPLAISKTLAMALAALLAITLDPALRMLFTRMTDFQFRPKPLARLVNLAVVGRYYPEERHPISRVLFWLYEPACRFVLRHRALTLVVALALVASTVPAYLRLGSEFMPPLNEGDFLYMPTALPGMSVTEAQRILQAQDRVLMTFPEVARVFGKAGRADTRPIQHRSRWSRRRCCSNPNPNGARCRAGTPIGRNGCRRIGARFQPPHLTFEELQNEMDQQLRFAGIPNIWTMPIKNRIDMLSTGVRTPIGIKISAPTSPSSSTSARSSRQSCAACPARVTCSPSAPPAATTSTSTSTAPRWRATASPSTTRNR